MIFTTALAIFLFPLARAQYGAPAGPATPTTTSASAPAAAPSAPPNTPGHMNIDVAFQTSFTFHPANITAPNGTLVTFWFPLAVNGVTHSVTQSSFEEPCTYLVATNNSSAGFDSGLTSSVQFTINVTDDTQPIWFHCKQLGHCGMGMVGSINAPSTGNDTFQNFQAAAVKIGSSEATETGGGPVTGGVNGIATATPANTGSASSPSPTSDGIQLTASTILILIFSSLLLIFL